MCQKVLQVLLLTLLALLAQKKVRNSDAAGAIYLQGLQVRPVLRVRLALIGQWRMSHVGRAQITASHYKALWRRCIVLFSHKRTCITGTKVQILTQRLFF